MGKIRPKMWQAMGPPDKVGGDVAAPARCRDDRRDRSTTSRQRRGTGGERRRCQGARKGGGVGGSRRLMVSRGVSLGVRGKFRVNGVQPRCIFSHTLPNKTGGLTYSLWEGERTSGLWSVRLTLWQVTDHHMLP